jgi:prepilin-type processing-associated H-X9-DG protein
MSLVETLLTIGIIALIAMLILPAVQKVRVAALQIHCQNNLKQLGLAIQQYASNHTEELPSCQKSGESTFVAILPYLEHNVAFTELTNQGLPRGNPYTIKNYLCPSDFTVRPQGNPWPCASYAANAQVFRGRPTMRKLYDGSSNTLLFAEHYSLPIVNNWHTQFDWYCAQEPEILSPPILQVNLTLRRATFADFEVGIREYRPELDDVYPVTTGTPASSIGSIPDPTFQVCPREEDTDPRIAQTPHRGGIPVSFGDGSVRILAQGMAPTAYWALVTPAGGESIDSDW